jgi:glutathione S-transferase
VIDPTTVKHFFSTKRAMTIELYWTAGGPFALRCLMTLAVKNLHYRSHQLDLTKGENRTPEFLAINPSGMLPVLVDKDAVVRESQAIVFYLDRAYPVVPLWGESPAEAGAIMQELCEQQSYAEPVLLPLLRALLFNRPATPDDIAQSINRFHVLLNEINAKLAATGWLASERISAADINLYPLVHSAVQCLSSEKAADLSLKKLEVSELQNLLSWMQRLQPFAQAER